MQEVIDMAFDGANNVASVPTSLYDSMNSLIGWDLGTTSVGAGLMSIAAITDIIPYLGNIDDPFLYPLGAMFLEQASQNRSVIESTEEIFVNKIGKSIRSIVPGSETIIPEKTTDPAAYAIGGAIIGATAIGAIAIALSH